MNSRFDYTILEAINNAIRSVKAAPLSLGGVAGSGGGIGGPIGGIVGWLPQTKVAYDLSEIASSGIPESGWSMLDNLNHIRYRVQTLESGGGASAFTDLTDVPVSYTGSTGKAVIVNPTEDGLIFGEVSPGISILDTGSVVSSGTTEINFVGADVTLSGIRTNITLLMSGSPDSTFIIDGELVVASGAANPFIVTRNTKISYCYIYCKDTGTSGTTIVDINKTTSGVMSTLFTTQANRPTLSWNDPDKWSRSVPDITHLSEGDILSLDIDSTADMAANMVVAMVMDNPYSSSALSITDGYTTVSGVIGITVSGGTVVNDSGGYATINISSSPSSSSYDYILVEDQKTSGTHGGASSNGAWRVRDINTEVTDTGNHCTISANRITLNAGTYIYSIRVPADYSQGLQSKLYNYTDSVDEKIGSNGYTSGDATCDSWVKGKMVLSSAKTFEIQYRVYRSQATYGLGVANGFGTEIYTQAEFWKVA